MKNKKALQKNINKLSIMQAAEDIIQKKHYSEITMDEIAQIAGVTKKTVYASFPSKLSLFISIFENYLQMLHRRMLEDIDRELPVAQTLKQLFNTLFQHTLENEKMLRLFWALESEEADGMIPLDLASRVNLWTKAIFDEMIGYIKEGIKQGIVRDYEPEMIIHMFSAINKGIFIHTNKQKRFNIADIEARNLFDPISDIMFSRILV